MCMRNTEAVLFLLPSLFNACYVCTHLVSDIQSSHGIMNKIIIIVIIITITTTTAIKIMIFFFIGTRS